MGPIAELDSRISMLEEQVARLMNEILDLKSARNSANSLARFPDELLVRVAELSLSDGYADTVLARESCLPTWICRRIRTVLVNTPQLWTRIQMC